MFDSAEREKIKQLSNRFAMHQYGLPAVRGLLYEHNEPTNTTNQTGLGPIGFATITFFPLRALTVNH